MIQLCIFPPLGKLEHIKVSQNHTPTHPDKNYRKGILRRERSPFTRRILKTNLETLKTNLERNQPLSAMEFNCFSTFNMEVTLEVNTEFSY